METVRAAMAAAGLFLNELLGSRSYEIGRIDLGGEFTQEELDRPWGSYISSPSYYDTPISLKETFFAQLQCYMGNIAEA